MTRRLVLSYLAVTIFVLAVLEVPLALNYSQHQVDQVTSKVLKDAYSLTGAAEYFLVNPNDSTTLTKLQTDAKTYGTLTGGRVVVTDRAGFSFVDTTPLANSPTNRSFESRPEIALAIKGTITAGTRDSKTLGGRIVFVAVPVFSNSSVVGVVRITYSISTVDTRIHRYWLLLLLLGGLASISVPGVQY